MNRTRSMLLAGVLGAFGFGTTSAQAQYMGVASALPGYAPVPSAGSYVAPQPAPRSYGGYYFTAPTWHYRPAPRSVTHHQLDSAYDPSGRHEGRRS
jgi:hypothetical protein